MLLSSSQYKSNPLSSDVSNPSAISPTTLNAALNAGYSYLAPLIIDAYVQGGDGRSTLSGPTSGLDDDWKAAIDCFKWIALWKEK